MNNDKNIKLIAADMDGTLLDGNAELSDYNAEILKALIKNGIEIIFATGRPFESVKKFKDAINNDNCSIICNGAAVADTNGKFLYTKSMDENSSKMIIDLFNESKDGICLNIYSDGKYYISEEGFYFKKYIEREGIENIIVGLEKIEIFEFVKVLFLGEHEKLLTLQENINKSIQNADAVFSHPEFLEIIPKGVNKAHALKWLCDKKKIDYKNIMVFGDNYNDLDMINLAGIGVAVQNAVDEVKNNADYIAPSHDKDGVGKFLKEFFEL